MTETSREKSKSDISEIEEADSKEIGLVEITEKDNEEKEKNNTINIEKKSNFILPKLKTLPITTPQSLTQIQSKLKLIYYLARALKAAKIQDAVSKVLLNPHNQLDEYFSKLNKVEKNSKDEISIKKMKELSLKIYRLKNMEISQRVIFIVLLDGLN